MLKKSVALTVVIVFTITFASTSLSQPTLDPNWQEVPNLNPIPPGIWGLDFEKVTGDNYRDIVAVRTFLSNWDVIAHYFPSSPNFVTWELDFLNGVCFSNIPNVNVHQGKFGQLRSINSFPEDYAILYTNQFKTYVTQNNSLVFLQTVNNSNSVDLTWAYITSDIVQDLIVSTTSGVKMFSNLGTGYVSTTGVTLIPNSAFDRIIATDINDLRLNTRDDLLGVFGDYDEGHIIAYENVEGELIEAGTIDLPMNNGIIDIAVGDMNNDNYNDVVISCQDVSLTYNNLRIYIYLNMGDGEFDIFPDWNTNINSQCSCPIALGEYNYDGKPDIVYALHGPIGLPGSDSPGAYILQNNGNMTFTPAWNSCSYPTMYFEFFPAQIAFVDFFGLGAQSIVISASIHLIEGYSSSIYYCISSGDAKPTPPKNFYIEEDPVSHHPVLNWDFNTEDDIFQYKVYRNITLPHQSTPDGWEEIATRSSSQNSYTDDEIYIVGQNDFAVIEYYVTALDLLGDPTSLESDPSEIIDLRATYHPSGSGEALAAAAVTDFSLSATPNPFNNHTSLKLNIPETGQVSLKLYDISGREVISIYGGYISAGEHTMNFDASALSSGIYFARLASGNKQAVVKLVLVK